MPSAADYLSNISLHTGREADGLACTGCNTFTHPIDGTHKPGGGLVQLHVPAAAVVPPVLDVPPLDDVPPAVDVPPLDVAPPVAPMATDSHLRIRLAPIRAIVPSSTNSKILFMVIILVSRD
jgi:hypothetical protein